MTTQDGTIIDLIVSKEAVALPTAEILLQHYSSTDPIYHDPGCLHYDQRCTYIKHLFPVLTDNFMQNLQNLVQRLGVTSVIELACGTGWLSYWMKAYNIPVQAAVDNGDWTSFAKKRLEHVIQGDAVEYVTLHPTVDMFVLSWPDMDDLAHRIWDAMSGGQYLLYIGEGESGCNADDAFFEAVNDCIDEDESAALCWGFLTFWGIHDGPQLIHKPNRTPA